MIRIWGLIALVTTLFALDSLTRGAFAGVGENNGNEEASLCVVTEKPSGFEGKEVQMSVLAEAALHGFDVFLSDPSCPERGMFVTTTDGRLNKDEFRKLLVGLYPGYPDDDGYLEIKIPIRVKRRPPNFE